MKFIKTLALTATAMVAVAGILLSTALAAEEKADKYVEGTHYKLLNTPIPAHFKEGQIGVIWEVFSYSCGHCNAFEPTVEAWLAKKPENIGFEPVPVMFNARQAGQAKSFYAAKFMKIAPEAHAATYNAIHGGGRRLGSVESFADFYQNFDLDKEKFMAMAESFGVQSRVNFAQAVTTNGEVEGTPSIIVNGKYLVSGKMAGSNSNMLKIAEYIVLKEAAAK